MEHELAFLQMNTGLDWCAQALGVRHNTQITDAGLLVPTDVMLPNWTQCVVIVQGRPLSDRVIVTDGGAAFASIVEGGYEPSRMMIQAGRRSASKFGLTCDLGVILSPPVPLDEVEQAVMAVANAMRDVANAVWDTARKHDMQRFRERVSIQLNRIFANATVRLGARITGASSDNLRFDFGITTGSRTLMVDAPMPDGTSIASVVLRQSDLRQAHLQNVRQAIVFDENDRWPSSSLSQLNLANVPVFSQRTLENGLLELSRQS